MKSDPKDCLYCQNNETLHNLMIEIAQLSVSRVFLFKEQTYRGRCLVAYKDHVNDLLLQPFARPAFLPYFCIPAKHSMETWVSCRRMTCCCLSPIRAKHGKSSN